MARCPLGAITLGVTKIEWVRNRNKSAGMSWNPTEGCSRVSPGCDNCYAMRFEHRFSGRNQRSEGLTIYRGPNARRPGVDWSGVVRLNADKLTAPLRRKKPTTWFVNSTSDLFHAFLSNEDIAAVFGVMEATPQHTYIVLTKRAGRLPGWFKWAGSAVGSDVKTGRRSRIECDPFVTCQIQLGRRVPQATLSRMRRRADSSPWKRGEMPPVRWPLHNLVLGVSAESQEYADERIPHLLSVPAAKRLVSIEPQLEAVSIRALAMSSPRPAECVCGASHGFTRCPNTGGVAPTNAETTGCGAFKRRAFADGLHWVITGGESGNGARPYNVAWARQLRDECRKTGIAFFLKQMGAFPVDHIDRLREWPRGAPSINDLLHEPRLQMGDCFHRVHLDHSKGSDPSEWPEDLRVREDFR